MGEDQEDKMEQIYERFRNDLANNPSDLYYDEMDLVDVFDYAGDVHDDYVRTEVLTLASRLYPNSDEFAKRRAIFLASISNDAFRSFMANCKFDRNDQIWAILQCRAEYPQGDEADAALHHIASLGLDDDETIIQFVALVKFLQREKWLIDNLDFIRTKCRYEQTLLFEIARLSETNPEFEISITLLEELTMLDPFNVNYWGLLAELQANTGKFEDALNSLDYAKAITPDDDEMLAMEGYIKLRLEKPAEAIEPLERAVDINPNLYVAKRNLLQAYKSTGNIEAYLVTLPEVYEMSPGDPALLVEFITNFPDLKETALARFYQDNDPDETQICQMAGEMCNNGNRRTALEILLWFEKNYSLSQGGCFTLIELFYINGLYQEAYRYFCDNVPEAAVKPQELPIIGITASILVRVGMYDQAREFCTTWLKNLEVPALLQSGNRLVNRGLKKTLTDIKNLVERPDRNFTEDELDAILL